MTADISSRVAENALYWWDGRRYFRKRRSPLSSPGWEFPEAAIVARFYMQPWYWRLAAMAPVVSGNRKAGRAARLMQEQDQTSCFRSPRASRKSALRSW